MTMHDPRSDRARPRVRVATDLRSESLRRLRLALWFAVLLMLGMAAQRTLACEPKDDDCRAYEVGVRYVGDALRNTSGGIATGGAFLDMAHLTAAIDGDAAFGVPGLRLFADVLYNNRATFSDRFSGDAQVLSNIDTRGTWRLYELWMDLSFGARSRTSLRAGVYDLNTEFNAVETGGLFLSSSQGITPEMAQSGLAGPSIFPLTAATIRLRSRIGAAGYAAIAALDAVPGDPSRPNRMASFHIGGSEGALLVAEAGYRSEEHFLKVAAGTWQYTSRFDALNEVDGAGNPVKGHGSRGFYALVEGHVASIGESPVHAFLRGGVAEPRFNPVGSSIQAGVTLGRPFAARPDDLLGFAVAHARSGRDLRAASLAGGAAIDRAETALELTYRAAITDWLSVQPDVQYIVNPGFDPTLRDAFVVGLRFQVQLSYGR